MRYHRFCLRRPFASIRGLLIILISTDDECISSKISSEVNIDKPREGHTSDKFSSFDEASAIATMRGNGESLPRLNRQSCVNNSHDGHQTYRQASKPARRSKIRAWRQRHNDCRHHLFSSLQRGAFEAIITSTHHTLRRLISQCCCFRKADRLSLLRRRSIVLEILLAAGFICSEASPRQER